MASSSFVGGGEGGEYKMGSLNLDSMVAYWRLRYCVVFVAGIDRPRRGPSVGWWRTMIRKAKFVIIAPYYFYA